MLRGRKLRGARERSRSRGCGRRVNGVEVKALDGALQRRRLLRDGKILAQFI